MSHRLKSKFDSRGRPGVESLWGQRTSGTKMFGGKRRHWKARAFGDKEDRGQRSLGTKTFGDKDVRGQRRQRRAGKPLGTKKFGDKGGRGELGDLRGQRSPGTKE